jgi:hypothetical protein
VAEEWGGVQTFQGCKNVTAGRSQTPFAPPVLPAATCKPGSDDWDMEAAPCLAWTVFGHIRTGWLTTALTCLQVVASARLCVLLEGSSLLIGACQCGLQWLTLL